MTKEKLQEGIDLVYKIELMEREIRSYDNLDDIFTCKSDGKSFRNPLCKKAVFEQQVWLEHQLNILNMKFESL